MRGHNVTVLEFNAKRRVGKRLGNDAFHLNGFFFRQGLLSLCPKRPANCAEIIQMEGVVTETLPNDDDALELIAEPLLKELEHLP